MKAELKLNYMVKILQLGSFEAPWEVNEVENLSQRSVRQNFDFLKSELLNQTDSTECLLQLLH